MVTLMNKKPSFQRIFLIVADSAGIGEEPDAARFGDVGSDTFGHIAKAMGGLHLPNLESLGLGELDEIEGVRPVQEHPRSYCLRLRETSNGKDTMTGHWEMMGVNTRKPFMTFTDTGFPDALIRELEERTGHKIIGNCAASGTEILVRLGEEQMRDNSLIVYTSADSVLQIAAHEEVTGLEELYRCCEIARELCMRPEYRVGRVIARPYVGTSAADFRRVGAHRHDYALSPEEDTAMDVLKNAGLTVSCIGKISDIFNGKGVTRTVHTKNNEDGMDQTIDQVKNLPFQGLCFVNLVEFDSEFGHRRDPIGYGKALEAFDRRIGELLPLLKEDDLLMITADHGNDPTFRGTDHTREKVPLLAYSPSFRGGRFLGEKETFACIGATILKNFGLEKPDNLLGEPISELLDD